jgi:hypothetical protein
MATQKFYTDLGLETAGDLQVDGNTTITGNLTVNGSSVTVESTTTSVADSLIELAKGNTTNDTLDIGIYGNYNDGLGSEGGASEFTGLFRDATDSTWKLFDGLEEEPTATVNLGGTNYALADLTLGDLNATTLTIADSIAFNGVSNLNTGTVTTASTSATNLDTFAIGTYRSGHYQVSISDATGSDYQSTELMVLHDGTTPSLSQYGTVLTDGELVTFAVDIDSGNLRVRITPATTNSTVFKFKRTLIVV